MRALVNDYLDRRLSRRGFMRRMGELGFSLAAVESIVDSLAPLAHAAEPAVAVPGVEPPASRVVEGTGGDLLVEQLRDAGVEFLFNCNSSGTSPILDALVDRPDLHLIQLPQEGQMIAVAEGYALATGKTPFTLNGSVGFPNTLNNMYNAWKDRTPIVIGAQREPSRVQGGRDAFEDWDDYLGPSASFTRWRWSIEQPERIPEFTRRAFKIASTPPAGPVALAFPTEALSSKKLRASVIAADKFMLEARVRPDPRLVEEAARLMVEARSPLLIVGPEVTRSGAQPEVIKLAEQTAIAVAQGERLFADFPTNHPLFVGDYVAPIPYPYAIDLVVNLGGRMPYQDSAMPSEAKVVHVSVDPDAIAKVVPTDVGIVADVKEAARDLSAAIESMATQSRLRSLRGPRFEATRAYTASLRGRQEQAARAVWDSRPLTWERVTGELSQLLDKDAILVPEVAEKTWANEPWSWESDFVFAPGERTRIGRTIGSALGWGIGAAMGVKLGEPTRQVVALQGDGGFLFAQAESLWTMARYELPVIVVIFNNRSYNGPRNKIWLRGGRQAETGKDMSCYLGDPDVDFAKLATAFGVEAETVAGPDQVRPAIERAIRATREGKPYLIDAIIARTGHAADSTWYPKYTIPTARKSEPT